MHFDGWATLLACEGRLLKLDVGHAEGLLFLNSHELENLLLLYGDISSLIAKDVRLNELARHDPVEVRQALVAAARRFFAAAAMKYAAMELRRVGDSTVLMQMGRFLERPEKSIFDLLCAQRNAVKAAGFDWPRLRGEILAVHVGLRTRFRIEGLGADLQNDHYIRLADGKGLLNRLRQLYPSAGPWDGHLVDAVSKAGYAGLFKEDLLLLTARA